MSPFVVVYITPNTHTRHLSAHEHQHTEEQQQQHRTSHFARANQSHRGCVSGAGPGWLPHRSTECVLVCVCVLRPTGERWPNHTHIGNWFRIASQFLLACSTTGLRPFAPAGVDRLQRTDGRTDACVYLYNAAAALSQLVRRSAHT